MLADIELTPAEHELCALLVRVADHVEQAQQQALTLRIAGGWVRDKLLGQQSHDLDVAVDRMSGYELAQHVHAYMGAHGLATHAVARISENPARSKHLETATTRVLGQLVDFVHLRSETYVDGTRIPRVAFGTPAEDARRRDITINALFYNLRTRRVEDFTGRGLDDLRAGVVRTPMEPAQTFADDPLRVLRVLRFASRFGYEIEARTAAALALPEIRDALAAKISRERVGVEVDKMAAGARPLMSIELVRRFGLYDTVFAPPAQLGRDGTDAGEPDEPAAEPDVTCAVEMTQCVLRILGSEPTELVARVPPQFAAGSARMRRLLVLAAYLAPYAGRTGADRKRRAPAALLVVRDALKLPASDAAAVAAVHALAPRVAAMAAACRVGAVPRDALGRLVRDAGERWPAAALYAAAAALRAGSAHCDVEQTHLAFVDAVCAAGLAEAYAFKHLVNGRDAAALLGCRPGPAIKPVLDRVMDWQLRNPAGSERECREFILAEIAPGFRP
ncbi:CCA tRNA nucleotidyltransferase, mitochondrial [Coemansia sp. RSA 2706]|nr:CCA tRNA nucleotidyltransferase, mitochondrial [Coemansia sp. RSA 2711]KAJ2309003.1 CCA tRNA nucleotidyltransferase, mitochondrial [Coemansia sp. RSA 2706]KAJ2315697.1 CCA tRNA nucleotidyltransferase, mitochondrial [Coemansia sp. RSA 2705]KAJ2322439.1 CCA tRNA nucleotidyltransferase, mitochondrial [Coemansia sp. RSA 2704]KAJ2330225.1 CCA tRNA nucleotidyltransferase, mitochondrial [Coemansia sp. RSA 2702]KAJ2739986.1 CCA tRNA nucleotidyltransferase, mitochondrial [Coemansia sp. Cherry 401B]